MFGGARRRANQRQYEAERYPNSDNIIFYQNNNHDDVALFAEPSIDRRRRSRLLVARLIRCRNAPAAPASP
jgi:hypothetical protein